MKYLRYIVQLILLSTFLIQPDVSNSQEKEKIFPGADENTPSRAFYFDWINNQYEGTTEKHTLTNLEFFKWLHDEYGMKLDIYSLDVGNIDEGPYCAGVGPLVPYHCGTMNSENFKKQFPNGFGPLVEKAASFGCRLGVWMGPDGFGFTPEEEEERSEMMIKFCRDHNFMLFKVDGCAGTLRPEKEKILIETYKECRKYCPDLIVLSERVDFGSVTPYTTTLLWEGVETYIDVFSWNSTTATHHRVGTLERETVPGMKRLIEDHGVCISSCLDFWEDDLILQTFNRSLILAPEIYGSPWFLRDDEFPKLARICNLHRRFGDILVKGEVLPKETYGPHAVTRGDGNTRFLTLRNITWNPVKYKVQLDESIGLTKADNFELRRFHPSEKMLGKYKWGQAVEVEVQPFRTYLLMVSSKPTTEIGVEGCDYEIVRDTPDKPVIVKLLGMPGQKKSIKLSASDHKFTKATLDGKPIDKIIKDKKVSVKFPGKSLKKAWHRKIADLETCAVPEDAEALYEATCFAADNNALEVRSIQRSGPSNIPCVQKARQVFFEKPMFINRAIWDKNLFDGDLNTFFIARYEDAALRIDFGEVIDIDKIVIKIQDIQARNNNREMNSFDEDNKIEISKDLKTWKKIGSWSNLGYTAIAKLYDDKSARYVRVEGAPARIAEIEGFFNGEKLATTKWRVSNLFFPYWMKETVSAYSTSFELNELPKGSYLAIAINGKHGDEGAYAALRVDGKLVGAPDRAVSFPSNTWEYQNVAMKENYTYYVPLTEDMFGKKIEAVVLVSEKKPENLKPEVWITAYPNPFESRELVLYK